jgi:hypothetical protein
MDNELINTTRGNSKSTYSGIKRADGILIFLNGTRTDILSPWKKTMASAGIKIIISDRKLFSITGIAVMVPIIHTVYSIVKHIVARIMYKKALPAFL